MNQTEITRLVAAAASLRPDWPHSSLLTFITQELAGRPYRDAAVALTWVATDPDTKTPRRVLEAGPWWQAIADPSQRGATPDLSKGHKCQSCPGWVVPGDGHTCGRVLDPDQTRQAAAAARAAIKNPPEESQP